MASNNETTTKFKVDISELKAAMQTARKEVALANSEFKAASSGMDNWSESGDGISAKLKQLNSNLSSQETVLKEYEKALEKVKAEYGENSVEAMEYQTKLNNQQAVVNQIERQIRQYAEALDKAKEAEETAARSSEELDEALDDTGDSAEDAGEGFTVFKGVLADLVADGIKAVSEALKDLITDSADAYAQFSASTGTAVDAMGEYEDAIKSIYKNNFGESLTDVAEKMARVKEVTGELDASKLQDMTEKAMTLEDVFGMDMTETLRGVQSLMTHFGMTSEEAFDYLASGAQNGLNYTDELGDNISEYAGKFAEAGYSAEEYFQLLQNGADGGSYNLDKVNDAINEVTTRLADGTIGDAIGSFSSETKGLFEAWQNGEATQKQVIDSIVTDIQNTTSEQEKMNLAASAFGTMAEDGGTKFIESLTAVGNTYDNVQGKADELANTKYDTPMAAIQGIGRTIKVDLLQPLADKLMPYLNDLATWVETNLPVFIEKIKEVGTKLQAWSPIIEAITAAIVGVIATLKIGSVVTSLIAAFTAAGGAAGILTTALTALKVAIAAVGGPVTLVIAAIVALVAGFIVLWKKSETFRNFWIGLWETIKSAFDKAVSGIITFFTETIPDAFNSVINWIKNNWTTILTFLINPFAGLFKYFYENNSKFREFVDNAITAIKELPTKVSESFSQWRDDMLEHWELVKMEWEEKIQNIIESVVNFFNTLPERIGYALGYVLGTIVKWALNVWDFITVKIPEIIESIVTFFSELPAKIWEWLLNTYINVTTWASNMLTKAYEMGSNFVNSLVTFFSQLPSKIWTWLVNTIAKITTWAANMRAKAIEAASGFISSVVSHISQLPAKVWEWLVNTITKLNQWREDMKQKGKEAIEGLINKVIEGAQSIPEKMMSIGKNIVDGVWQGIQNAKDQFFDNVKGFFSGLVDGAKSALGIHSPSKVFANEVGKWIPKGLAVGIDANADSALKSMKNLSTELVGTARNGLASSSASLNTSGSTGGVVNNFYQTNNSPKALSRLEIYRQSKNLLGYAGGV